MSRLYALSRIINDHLERSHAGDPLVLIRAKGEVAARVGFLVSMVTPQDDDDPAKVAALEEVARTLNVQA